MDFDIHQRKTLIAICDLCTDGLSALIELPRFREYIGSWENSVKMGFLCLNKFSYLHTIAAQESLLEMPAYKNFSYIWIAQN